MRRYLTLFFLVVTIGWSQSIYNKVGGYSFELPQGWKYQENGYSILLGHDTIAGLIIVYKHSFENMAVLEENMNLGIAEDGVFLKLVSPLSKVQNHILKGEYSGIYGMEEVKAQGYGVVFQKGGGGAIVIAITTPQSYSKELIQAADTIAYSLKVSQTSLKDNNIIKGNLMQRFVGKWTTMTKYSESNLYLYADGTYIYNNESSYGNSDVSAGATWGMAQENQNRGRWHIEGSLQEGVLIITEPNGVMERYPYHIHIENGVVYENEYYFGENLYFRR